MVNSSFPLIKLPIVALQAIYEVIHPAALYNLSKCSTIMRFSVKSLCQFVKNHYDIIVQLSPDSNVLFVTHGASVEEGIGIGIEKTSATRTEIVGINETIMAVRYLLDLFHPRDFRARMSVDLENDSSNAAFEWIVKNQKRFSSIVCFGGGPTDQERYQRCLTAFQKSPNVHVSAKVTDRFQLTQPVNTDSLSIGHSRWITIDALRHFTCRVLFLLDHGFSNEVLNTFLRDMQSGIRVHPNIDTLLLRRNDLAMDEILANLDENQIRVTRGLFRIFPGMDVFSVLNADGQPVVNCFETEFNNLQIICFEFPQSDWILAN